MEAEIYQRFAHRIRLYGRRHLRDDAAAEDLVQQVLIVVLESLREGRVREPEKLASYVLGTCRLVVQGLRSGETRRRGLLKRFDVPANEAAEAPAGVDVERLRRCLEGLSARERTVVLLTFCGDREGEEIGAELGMTAGNVRVVRHRAVGRLQECMGVGEAA